jgi:type IV secretory pathway VirB2 component (pilin)
MKKILAKVKGYSKKAVMMAVAVMALMSQAFAAPNTGNADLDTILTTLDSGLTTIKTGGLYIVGGVVVIAVVFFGARWLFNMFRSWLARAQ